MTTPVVSARFLALWVRPEYFAVRRDFHPARIHRITKAYLGTLLWSSMDDDGISLIIGRTEMDIDYEDRLVCARDVLDFLSRVPREHVPVLDKLGDGGIGHNLVLTRNSEGCGFWSRGLGAAGDAMTTIAADMGPVGLGVGDDGGLQLLSEYRSGERVE